MTSRNIKFAAMALLLVIMVAAAVTRRVERPRIMVVQSYGVDYVWSRDVEVGLKRVFDGLSGIDVRYHFMATKRNPGADYQRRAGIAARNAVDGFHPNVLITVDDNAQDLVATHYVDDPNMKIVFAGINGSIKPYGFDTAKNVTGILERKPVAALREAVMLMWQAAHGASDRPPRAVFLSDATHSAKRDGEFLATADWGKVDYAGQLTVSTFSGWKTAVLANARGADYLLVGAYRNLAAKEGADALVPAEEVARWTDVNSPVPVIGMNIFNSEDGIMLSIGVSPYEQGEVAAEMTMDLVRGRKAIADMPVRTSRQYVVAIRRSSLERRGIRVPGVFEAFARATNNYFE